jgi:hypothetical protein
MIGLNGTYHQLAFFKGVSDSPNSRQSLRFTHPALGGDFLD